MRNVTEVVVHTAATPEGKHFTVEDIDRWHRQRGFNSIGYHWVVYLDGSVHAGRPEEKIGAHVAGRNRNTIGICYIGGVDANDTKKAKDTRTPEQKHAMVQLLREILERYPAIHTISGHHDYAAKACPCFPARKEYAYLTEGRKEDTKIASTLRMGSRGWEVKALQGSLKELGYPVNIDGHFGRETRNAVAAFQLDAEITSDGIVGSETRKELYNAKPVDRGTRGVQTAKIVTGKPS